MRKRSTALVVALAGAALLVGGCAAVEHSSTAGDDVPGSTPGPSMGASGAPGEANFDWPVAGIH
jgi:hypothetical protein